MIVENWKEFGVDATLDVRDNASRSKHGPVRRFRRRLRLDNRNLGRAPGPVLLPRVLALGPLQADRRERCRPQPDALAEPRARQDHRSRSRRSTSTIRRASSWASEFVKLAAQEMPIIPIMSYNVFSVCDETYWQGFPTAENPYTDPVAELGQHQVHVSSRSSPRSRNAAAGHCGPAGQDHDFRDQPVKTLAAAYPRPQARLAF